MIRVYCAGPITKPDMRANALIAIKYADVLLELGFAPFVPQLSVFWSEFSPHPYEVWLKLDFEWLSVCNALLRIPGESPGADREVQFAHDHFIPVFYSIENLTRYFKETK